MDKKKVTELIQEVISNNVDSLEFGNDKHNAPLRKANSLYDNGFRNANSFMLWNPAERSYSNCQYKNSRELCGEDYCGTKYWSPKLEE